MKKILHIITSIGSGGAERVLYNLISGEKKNKHLIISLSSPKSNFHDFNNIIIFRLNFNYLNFIVEIVRLFFLIKKIKPDIIQTWMYHADVIGGVVGKILGHKVIWNIRNSNFHPKTKKLTIFFLKISCLISKYIPDDIICCSRQAAIIHENIGYKKKISIINNSINSKIFPTRLFELTQIKNNTQVFIISYVGRWHDQKDFKTLINTLATLTYSFNFNNWKIILAGENLTRKNDQLIKLINSKNLIHKIKLLGHQKNLKNIYKLADINILTSSYGEGFPNVLIEAMSLGTPCISTDVGSCKDILSNLGWTVPIKSSTKLAKSIICAYNLKTFKNNEWLMLKNKCKKSIDNRFNLNKMINKYNLIWDKY